MLVKVVRWNGIEDMGSYRQDPCAIDRDDSAMVNPAPSPTTSTSLVTCPSFPTTLSE